MNFKFTIIDNIFKQFSNLKEKITNLSETNYQLGIAHLKKGHIWEALSRFKITLFFWPHNYKASYQYAYCLLLGDKIDNAKFTLIKIIREHPDYKEAVKLLNAIKNQEIDKVKQEYKEKLSQ